MPDVDKCVPTPERMAQWEAVLQNHASSAARSYTALLVTGAAGGTVSFVEVALSPDVALQPLDVQFAAMGFDLTEAIVLPTLVVGRQGLCFSPVRKAADWALHGALATTTLLSDTTIDTLVQALSTMVDVSGGDHRETVTALWDTAETLRAHCDASGHGVLATVVELDTDLTAVDASTGTEAITRATLDPDGGRTILELLRVCTARQSVPMGEVASPPPPPSPSPPPPPPSPRDARPQRPAQPIAMTPPTPRQWSFATADE